MILGANTRKDLLHLNKVAQERVLDKHMENGVNFVSTDGIIIGNDVEIGAETTILPGTILRGKPRSAQSVPLARTASSRTAGSATMSH